MRLNFHYFSDGSIIVSVVVRILFIIGVGIAPVALGQQNLFNVPSSDITIEGKPFFQQQINVDRVSLQLNSTFALGLGRDMEVGFNVLGVNINTQGGGPFFNTNSEVSNPPVYPFFTLNFQKAFPFHDVFKLAIGTQAGYSTGLNFGHYEYLNFVAVVRKIKTKLIAGAYHGSDTFLGPGDRNQLLASDNDPIGFQLGVEREAIREKLLLIAEHITGKNSFGVTSIGASYFVSHRWALSAGYQISNPGSDRANSLVFEATYVPSAEVYTHIFRRGHRMKVYE